MKVAVIGGGSFVWTLGLCNQFIRGERLDNVTVTLMDVDPVGLDLVYRAADICNRKQGSPVRIDKTTDLARALDGADFVFVSIAVGGLDAMQHDLEIPEKYGIRHTVGDTVGPGGWCRAIRNIPVFHDIAARMKGLCPEAWFINVSNPLTPLTRVPQKCFGIKTVGLCPGVEGQIDVLAKLAGCTDYRELDYVVTGVDHGSWLLRLFADGKDVLARLKELGYCRADGVLPTDVMTEDPLAETARTRAAFAVWREIGYLPSLADRHIVEFLPWFIARSAPELPYRIKRTSVAERRQWKIEKKRQFEAFLNSGDESLLASFGHGDDPVVAVIESLCGKRSFGYSVNYMNVGQIPGLPDGAVVETRARFDAAGVHPFCSPMPDVLKILTWPTVMRQEAIVDIALSGTFDDLVAVVLTDPLCSHMQIGQCREMMREMLRANGPLIKNPRLME